MNNPESESEFVLACRSLRVAIKSCGADVRGMHQNLDSQVPQAGVDLGETHANLQLAYRHLEDAAMRLGKAIQAYDGGVSVYDK